MVFNATSPIKNFQVKQKAAEIAPPAINTDEAARSDIAMSSFEQTPAAVALEENKIDEMAAPPTGASASTVKPEASKPTGEKSLPASPVLSVGFSDADTIKVNRDSNSSNLTTRSRQGWAGSVKRLIGRSASVLQSESKLSKPQPTRAPLKISDPIAIPALLQVSKARPTSKSTTNSSPVDPGYDPVKQRFRSPKDRKADATTGPITGPDEPRSFLDLDSSSDEDAPVVQRASSVRVGRPQIVRHASKSAKQASQYAERKDAGSPSIEKAEKVLGEPLVNLYDLSPASHQLERVSTGTRADALAMLEGKTNEQDDATLIPEPKAEDIKSTTIVVSDHPSNAESHDVYVSPRGDLSSIRASIISGDTVSPLPTKTILDGLRSNPMSDTEKSLLSRTISAPPLPNRNPNRRVTIRPADLVIHHPDHDHKLFRESIVTTPYPLNLTPVAGKGPKPADEGFKTPIGTRPTVSILPSAPGTTRTDRFPSPTSSEEHLFLTLTLASTPSASTTILITIPSSTPTSSIYATPYDDHALFTTIRSAYRTQLLGIPRLLFSTSRTLSHVTPGTSDMTIDSIDFIAHLNNPSLGKGKKGWLIWLRNQQPLPKRASSLFSSQSPESTHPSMGLSGAGHSHSNSMSNSINYYSPHSAHIPRMPFMRSHTHTLPPSLALHYRANVLSISIAVFLMLLISVMSTALWVLFGYPGLHAGSRDVSMGLGSVQISTETWRGDAQLRVLTGLVMGLVTLVLGGVSLGGWVLGGRCLL